jgi:RsiW-degrading membrane proteinase PrsW (M82 family)
VKTSAPTNAARSLFGRSLTAAGLPPLGDYARIVAIGIVLIVASLLAGSAGLAILFTVFVIPALTLRYLSSIDLVEREPWYVILAVIVIGGLIGIFMGLIGQGITDQLWIEHADFNVGAAGYGGRFAAAEGEPSALMILFGGMILPAISVLLLMIGPLLFRRLQAFRNEVMDGVTLGAAAGFGFAAATAILYYWSLIGQGKHPTAPLEDWTATLIGLAVVRPLLFGTVTAMIGAGIWHYALSARTADLVVPVVLGLGGLIVYSIGDVLTQPSGTRTELLWNVIILAIGLFIALRLVLRKALRHDRQILGDPSQRTVCPNCHRVTPTGAFCAHCGHPLPPPELVPTAPMPEPLPEPAPSAAEPPAEAETVEETPADGESLPGAEPAPAETEAPSDSASPSVPKP